MIDRLFIAEKPNLGRTIAEGLGRGTPSRGYITVRKDVVTWCFGHLLELDAPESYSKDYAWPWRSEVLPILPSKFTMSPRIDPQTQKKDGGVVEQIKIIKMLLKQCRVVVNAGDPDREGQLIVDELLEYLKYTGPAQRIWLASLDSKSVAKALASLKDNAEYRPLRDAALARSRVDWLSGMNLTRALSLFGWQKGVSGVLSMGRVQTPTLGLVVDRDREIENFNPVDYFSLQVPIQHHAGFFTAALVLPDDTPGTDAAGRIVDTRLAQAIVIAASGKMGVITDVERKQGKTAPPKPYSLSALQKDAGTKFGMSAQAVLDAAQALYDKKMATYPRTDCEFLPDEQFGEAEPILCRLAAFPAFADMAKGADASVKSSAWNTSRVTAHHAIIPTGITAADLKPGEKNCFNLIARNYILQFWQAETYETQKITLILDGKTQWEARGRVTLDPGFRRFMHPEQADTALPRAEKGDPCESGDVQIQRKQTSPPERFTEGTLIEAMKFVHRFVSDPGAKATLKDTMGIGTEATRAGILETLKKRGYLVQDSKKKTLASTDIGRAVVGLSPTAMRDVASTAVLEERLALIAQGRESLDAVVHEYGATLPMMIQGLFQNDARVKISPSSGTSSAKQRPKGIKGGAGRTYKPGSSARKPAIGCQFSCSECGGGLERVRSKQGAPLFICRNDRKHSRKKPLFFEEVDGAPVFPQSTKK